MTSRKSASSRPWDRDRDGFVIGEGAGILVLEELDVMPRLAKRSDRTPRVIGYGMSADAYHISAPHPDRRSVPQRVMSNALSRTPESTPSADRTTSTLMVPRPPLGDLGEVRAIKEVFGDHAYKLAVSSTKSSTGHLLGAAGGLEAGLLALALKRQVMPATLNLDEPDPEADLDFVPHEPREASFEIALTNSFGFGGTNGALVMRRFAD